MGLKYNVVSIPIVSITSNNPAMWENKEKISAGFTQKYNVDKLVYFETYLNSIEAIKREKQLKAGSRVKKVALIESKNSDWLDMHYNL